MVPTPVHKSTSRTDSVDLMTKSRSAGGTEGFLAFWSSMDWREHITVDPNVCHGKACIKGTRVPVSVVLDNLAAGVPINEIVESYPSLSEQGIRAALQYAAELASERVVSIPDS